MVFDRFAADASETALQKEVTLRLFSFRDNHPKEFEVFRIQRLPASGSDAAGSAAGAAGRDWRISRDGRVRWNRIEGDKFLEPLQALNCFPLPPAPAPPRASGSYSGA